MSSWIERVNTDFRISCGETVKSPNGTTDSQNVARTSFYPQWLNATKKVDYNISEFVFKEVAGSLVKRGNPRGTIYNLEIVFQGAANLDDSDTFKSKSDWVDPKTGYAPPWQIEHPLYGTIIVQPVSLTFDNTKFNVTTITAEVIETIDVKSIIVFPKDPVSTIQATAATNRQAFADTYVSDVPKLSVTDLQRISMHIKSIYASVSTKINGLQSDVDAYAAAYNQANAVLNTAIYDSMAIISQTQLLLNTPALFVDTVVNRLNMFSVQLSILSTDIANILSIYNRPTQSLKKLYENNAGTTIASMCVASITNITTDYDYRPSILSVIGTIINSYNSYMANLYTLQSPNGGQLDSYIPDANSITQLTLLVNYATSVLFNLTSTAKQQRTLTIPYDTNLILVANQLYGMQPDDSTITTLIANNNIGPNEYITLKQGKQIIYYI